jgi:hypothetical protein
VEVPEGLSAKLETLPGDLTPNRENPLNQERADQSNNRGCRLRERRVEPVRIAGG